MNEPTDTTAALLRAARAFLGAHWPGRFATSLSITLDDGQKVRLPVGPCVCPTGEAPAPKLNEMEKDVLEALGEATMSAEELSRAAGYQNDPAFRTCLAAMRRRGLLSGGKNEPGYSAANR